MCDRCPTLPHEGENAASELTPGGMRWALLGGKVRRSDRRLRDVRQWLAVGWRGAGCQRRARCASGPASSTMTTARRSSCAGAAAATPIRISTADDYVQPPHYGDLLIPLALANGGSALPGTAAAGQLHRDHNLGSHRSWRSSWPHYGTFAAMV
eukprot:gene18738-biopygen18985